MKFLLAIPVYDNARTIAGVVIRARGIFDDVVVIDDGSTDDSRKNAEAAGARVLVHEHNRGKGEALKTALVFARGQGYSHVVTLDGDGQHFPEDAPALIKTAREEPRALVLGQRALEAIPGKNRFGNRFSNVWVNWAADTALSDTQCGFRIYPTDMPFVFHAHGYAFETEAMVKHARSRAPLRTVSVRVAYPEVRVSHFHPGRDATRIVFLVMRFLFLPRWFW